jgi:hypothetical protein
MLLDNLHGNPETTRSSGADILIDGLNSLG